MREFSIEFLDNFLIVHLSNKKIYIREFISILLALRWLSSWFYLLLRLLVDVLHFLVVHTPDRLHVR